MATTNGVTRRSRSLTLRRRPSFQQGRALEILGHAIEYLMDSYLTTASPTSDRADHEAIQMLERLNLEIFHECPEVIPYHQRLRAGLSRGVSAIETIFIFN